MVHSESFKGLQADVTLEVIPISSALAAQRNGDPWNKNKIGSSNYFLVVQCDAQHVKHMNILEKQYFWLPMAKVYFV